MNNIELKRELTLFKKKLNKVERWFVKLSQKQGSLKPKDLKWLGVCAFLAINASNNLKGKPKTKLTQNND